MEATRGFHEGKQKMVNVHKKVKHKNYGTSLRLQLVQTKYFDDTA